MKAWLVIHLLTGDPIYALVEHRQCLAALETFKSGHDLELTDDSGAQPVVIDVECSGVCLDEGCV